jgi:hypothetical protein
MIAAEFYSRDRYIDSQPDHSSNSEAPFAGREGGLPPLRSAFNSVGIESFDWMIAMEFY